MGEIYTFSNGFESFNSNDLILIFSCFTNINIDDDYKILECPEINLFDITKYNDINNFNLYSDSGNNSSKYSSLDYAFKLLVPKDAINNYNDHNLITIDDKKNYKMKINKYKNNL